MSKLAKNGTGISPFNCIAMKDIKDKNSKKGDLRPLFDCVSTIGESIDKLHSYLDNSQDESGNITAHVKTLTGIQTDLLAICQGKIAKQNEYVPGQDNEDQEDASDTQQVLPSEEAPEVKSKIKV